MMLTGTGTRDIASQKSLNYYSTPYVAVRTLMRHAELPHTIWEPLCGSGAIVKPLRAEGHRVIASDLVDRGCPDAEAGIDFLSLDKAPAGTECIASNPPYNNSERIIHHALYTLKVPKVYMLMRLAFLEGGNLRNHKGECRRMLLDGGHLSKILLFRRRLPMIHRENYEGKKNSNSGMPMGWFCWDLTGHGNRIVERVDWIPEESPWPEPALSTTAILPPTPLEVYINKLKKDSTLQ